MRLHLDLGEKSSFAVSGTADRVSMMDGYLNIGGGPSVVSVLVPDTVRPALEAALGVGGKPRDPFTDASLARVAALCGSVVGLFEDAAEDGKIVDAKDVYGVIAKWAGWQE